jgi:hypothetical protein
MNLKLNLPNMPKSGSPPPDGLQNSSSDLISDSVISSQRTIRPLINIKTTKTTSKTKKKDFLLENDESSDHSPHSKPNRSDFNDHQPFNFNEVPWISEPTSFRTSPVSIVRQIDNMLDETPGFSPLNYLTIQPTSSQYSSCIFSEILLQVRF